jgi:hypothetical protein
MVEDAFIDCRRPYASDFIIDIAVHRIHASQKSPFSCLVPGTIKDGALNVFKPNKVTHQYVNDNVMNNWENLLDGSLIEAPPLPSCINISINDALAGIAALSVSMSARFQHEHIVNGKAGYLCGEKYAPPWNSVCTSSYSNACT